MTTPKTIAIGCDHAGYEYKEALHSWLQSEGYVVLNFGTDSPESVDYPDYVHPLCTAVENQKADIGILLCGRNHFYTKNNVNLEKERSWHQRTKTTENKGDQQ